MCYLHESPVLSESTALMHLDRQKRDNIRARDFVARVLEANRRPIVLMTSIAIHEEVWFHRHRQRKGIVSDTSPPKSFVEFQRKLFHTHQTTNCPYLGELPIPMGLKGDAFLHNRPYMSQNESTTCRAPISDLLNPICLSFHDPAPNYLTFDITGTSFSISMALLTITYLIKGHKTLSEADKQSFATAKREELDLLLEDSFTPIHISKTTNNV